MIEEEGEDMYLHMEEMIDEEELIRREAEERAKRLEEIRKKHEAMI